MEREDEGHVLEVCIHTYIHISVLSVQCYYSEIMYVLLFVYLYRGLVIAQEMAVLRFSSLKDT